MPSLMSVELEWERLAHKHIFAPMYNQYGFEFFVVDYVGEIGQGLQHQGIDVIYKKGGVQKTIDEKAVKKIYPLLFIEQHGTTRNIAGRGWLHDSKADYLAYSMSDTSITKIHIIEWAGRAQEFIRLEVARDMARWAYGKADRDTQARGWLIPPADLRVFTRLVEVETPKEIAAYLAKLSSDNVLPFETGTQ